MVSVNKEQPPAPTYEQMNLIDDYRRLWSDLRICTRTYMLSTVSGLPNADAVGKRLYSIPLDFLEKLETFYRQDSAEQFVQLLSMHIILSEQIINGIKQGDNEIVDASVTEIYKNADEIASLLASLNPYWSYEEWKSMLYHYISLMIDQMVALMSGEYEKDIQIYDRMALVSRKMGDYMADGILHQITSPAAEVS